MNIDFHRLQVVCGGRQLLNSVLESVLYKTSKAPRSLMRLPDIDLTFSQPNFAKSQRTALQLSTVNKLGLEGGKILSSISRSSRKKFTVEVLLSSLWSTTLSYLQAPAPQRWSHLQSTIMNHCFLQYIHTYIYYHKLTTARLLSSSSRFPWDSISKRERERGYESKSKIKSKSKQLPYSPRVWLSLSPKSSFAPFNVVATCISGMSDNRI